MGEGEIAEDHTLGLNCCAPTHPFLSTDILLQARTQHWWSVSISNVIWVILSYRSIAVHFHPTRTPSHNFGPIWAPQNHIRLNYLKARKNHELFIHQFITSVWAMCPHCCHDDHHHCHHHHDHNRHHLMIMMVIHHHDHQMMYRCMGLVYSSLSSLGSLSGQWVNRKNYYNFWSVGELWTLIKNFGLWRNLKFKFNIFVRGQP